MPTKLEALLASAVDAIITIDANARIEQANPAAELLFGYSAEQFIGRNVKFLMPEPWASRHDGYIRRYQETGEERIIGIGREVEGLRSDGTTFPMHLAVSQYEADGAIFYTGIIHDLSKRKRFENALVRAQKMESIGHLTGGIAHDFNNLLTIITGNLELLEMQLDDAGQRELLKEAQDAAGLGADLTARLLAFARRSMLEPKIFDVNRMLRDLVVLLRRTVGGNTQVVLKLEDEPWAVRSDAGQLESALVNLAVNAREAMPEGGKLTVETRNTELDYGFAADEIGVAAGEYLAITASDTGHGMEAATLKRAFEPFFTTKGESKGSGLGLAMVYGFAKQSGGTATIYSEVGLGTSITVYLPRHRREADGEEAKKEAHGMQGGGEHVLVVEDDPHVRRLTCKRLEALNYVATAASSGEEALELLAANRHVDMVFTDLIMPGGMSGIDLARKVHAARPALPVLLTSGYTADLLGDGVPFELLRKPYRQDDLAAAIHRTLENRQVPDTSAAKV